jgi:TolB-like protein/tetratricopeptide (TPR) repeat protein
MPSRRDPSWGDCVAALFEDALALPPELRDGFVRDASRGDAALAEEVRSLLASHERGPDALERLAESLLSFRRTNALPPVGSTISHYRIEERIGGGAEAAVFRARDLVLGRDVALKFPNGSAPGEDRARAQLEAEARSVSALDHPNIGVVHEIGVARLESGESRLFIAMAYYPGVTLEDRLRNGPLTTHDAVSYAVQTAAGLAAMHAAGLVHRDIKPANLMLTTAGQLRIVDFGLATFIDSGVHGDGVTRGTVAYMSPEQTRGQARGPATDVWSLGVVLYEMLVGERPFAGDDVADVFESIRCATPRPLPSSVPPALAAVVTTCLRKDPVERYAHAGALLAALQAMSASQPTAAPLRRRTRALAGALVAALLLVSAARTATVVPDRSRSLPPLVVVAPFDDRTGSTEHGPIGSMAADWIVQGLSQTGVVRVVAWRATTRAARDGEGQGTRRLRRLAQESGTGFVVSGAYYLEHDSLRFHVRITDAATGHVVEAFAPIGAHALEPGAGLELVRQRVLAGLGPHLDPRTREYAAVASRTPSWDAWREYAAGMALYIDDGDNGSWRRALEHFAAAARIDTTFMLPLVRSALIHSLTNNGAAIDSIASRVQPHLAALPEYERLNMTVATSWARGDYAASYRSAVRLAELAPNTHAHWQLARELLILNRPAEALRVYDRLDPQRGELSGWFMYWIKLAEAHHLLGDYEGELRVTRQARALYPEHSNALRLELRALVALGRVAEAMRLLDEYLATPADGPYWAGPLLHATALELHAHGHAAAARRLASRSVAFYAALSETGRAGDFRRQLGEAYYLSGRWDDAERFVRTQAMQRPDALHLQGRLGTIAARRGDRVEAERIAGSLAALERPYLLGENTYWRARIAALLGEHEEAVSLLRTAYAEGRRWWLDLHFEPDLASLRELPSFRELLRPKG